MPNERPDCLLHVGGDIVIFLQSKPVTQSADRFNILEVGKTSHLRKSKSRQYVEIKGGRGSYLTSLLLKGLDQKSDFVMLVDIKILQYRLSY